MASRRRTAHERTQPSASTGPAAAGWLRHTALALTVIVALVALGVRASRQDQWIERYDAYFVHGFDGYPYLAMSEAPAVFTVAPWGYRLLTPALVHLLPGLSAVEGFRLVGFVALLVSAALLFLWLRRLGHGEVLSALAVSAFVLSPPVGELLRYPLLADPLPILIQIAFLHAIETGAAGPRLAFLLAAGALSKEGVFAVVPLVFLEGRPRLGAGTALGRTLAVAAPALVLTLVLRGLWGTAAAAGGGTGLDLSLLAKRLQVMLQTSGDWGSAALLLGVTPLAILGALRAQARPYLLRYGYLIAAFGVLPFLSGILISQALFFQGDVPRLLLYVLPLLLPLACTAAERVWPPVPAGDRSGVPPASSPSRHARVLWAAGTLALVAAPLLLDRYRRLDLAGPRDGPFVLTFCRETLDTARRLEAGTTVAFELADQVYESREWPDATSRQMRWFLRTGWGSSPQYGIDLPEMKEPEATLVVPVRRVEDLEVALTVDGGNGGLRLLVNGRPVAEEALGGTRREIRARLPASALFRGDNELRLAAAGAPTDRPRLVSYALRAVREAVSRS